MKCKNCGYEIRMETDGYPNGWVHWENACRRCLTKTKAEPLEELK